MKFLLYVLQLARGNVEGPNVRRGFGYMMGIVTDFLCCEL